MDKIKILTEIYPARILSKSISTYINTTFFSYN